MSSNNEEDELKDNIPMEELIDNNENEDSNKDNINKDNIINVEDTNNKNSSLNENIKINNTQRSNTLYEQEKEKEKEYNSDTKKDRIKPINRARKSLNAPFMEKIMNKILNLDEDEKAQLKKHKGEDDFFLFGLNKKRKKRKSKLPSIENIITEDSSFNINTSAVKHKKRSIIKGILELNRENEWNEFIDEYQKKYKEKGKLKQKLKLLFNINSDFMIIWKYVFSFFYMVILFVFFFKYVFLELPTLEEDQTPQKRILYLYGIINIMFGFDLILTIIIIWNNGGSLITFLKLPLKIYMIFPFPLKAKYIPFLVPKFCRVDLFRRVFNSNEQFILVNITHYIQNYNLRNFIIYTNRMFTYLVEFGLYAHFTCCVFSYLDEIKYISALYYTIETFTTIGFGENSPKTQNSIIIGVINLFIGINLFTIMTCNVNYLASKIYQFNRETSLKKQLEFLFFQMQSSTGKVFPSHLKELISFFILFRRGLSYKDIKTQYEPILKVCRNKIIKDIRKSLLYFLRKEYFLCFPNCEREFINSLLEVLKPKIFKTNKVIVKYGEKVKYLYFLINGELFAYNKKGNPVYSIVNSALFCEYEFITGTTSDFTIKVHPKMPAYGFVINREDWENITKNYIYSIGKFINLVQEKRKRHLQWLHKSFKRNRYNLEISDNYNNEDLIYENENTIEDNNKLKKVNSKENLMIPANSKNIKYNFEYCEIIKKINDFNKQIQIVELSLIEYKRKIMEFLTKKDKVGNILLS